MESFENLTGDSGQVYLAKGITDQLEAELAQIGALRVVGLSDIEGNTPALQAAGKLGVDVVLAGSLQRAGSTLHITAQLKSVTTRQAVWARTFDGDLSTILQLQADVARAVAERIRVSLTPGERSKIAGSRPSVTPAAYEAYVRGAYFLGRGDGDGLSDSHRLLPEGDRCGSDLRGGVCWNGEQLHHLGLLRNRDAGGNVPESQSGALKALELDSDARRGSHGRGRTRCI